MQKKKAVRLAGFVGAVCATGALVGFGVSGTGAYFTDSHSPARSTRAPVTCGLRSTRPTASSHFDEPAAG